MTKKHIIMIIIVVFFCFLSAFGSSLILRKASAKAQESEKKAVAEGAIQQAGEKPAQKPEETFDKNALLEQQLKSFTGDLKEKMREYSKKLEELEQREQRMQTAEGVIKKEVEKLDNLRLELASSVAAIRQEEEKLLASRIKIDQAEKANLTTVAATYDKMDAASASKILINMSQMATQSLDRTTGVDEAVKILYFMTERTKAKVLAEMVTSEPKLAATISEKLKQVYQTD